MKLGFHNPHHIEHVAMVGNILLVEYEQRYVDRVRAALAETGHRVEVAGDLDRAVDICAHFEPQLVVMTSVLPRLEVEDAITQLRARAGLRLTPFLILMSGYDGESPQDDAARYGAQDILERPFTGDALRLRVERLLSAAAQAGATQAIPVADVEELRRQHGMTSDESLTSADLFADIVSDVEEDERVGERVGEEAVGQTEVAGAAADDRLNQVLAEVRQEPAAAPPERRPLRSYERDVDDMLSETLAGLDVHIAGIKAARAQASPPPPEAVAAEPGPPATPSPPPLELPVEESAAGPAPEDLAGEVIPEAAAEAVVDTVPGEPSTPPPPPSPPAAAGTQFGQYLLEEHIATGGMAEVYRARMLGMEGFQKTVAIKRILSHLTGNDEFVKMLIDEAKLAAQLNHNNIIHIYDLGKIGDSYYIAMEYIEGRDLRSILQDCREKGVLVPVPLALHITALLASALDYAHRKRDFENRDLGLVHRDVSPQNVLISDDGDIKLCDFGIAKAASKASHTRSGALKGKLQYMSPEQARGAAVDHRSDIFSLGLVLYEMLTGEKVFAGTSETSVLEQVRDPKISAPSRRNREVPPQVDRIVLKALEPDPERRYQSARDLARDVEEVMHGRGWALDRAGVAAFVRHPEAAAAHRKAAATGSPPPPVGEEPAAPAVEPAREPELVGVGDDGGDAGPPRGRRRLWLVLVVLLLVAAASAAWIYRDRLLGLSSGSEAVPPAVEQPTPTPSPIPTSVETDLLQRASELAEAEVARQEEDLRRRLEAEFPEPTPLPPTATPTETATPSPTATETPTLPPPTPTRPPPTATPVPPSPTPAVREGDLMTSGVGVVAPVLMYREEPEYPPAALKYPRRGEVVAEALVGPDGAVEDVRIVSADPPGIGFEEATAKAVARWRYKPATKNGVRVRVWVRIQVGFRYR